MSQDCVLCQKPILDSDIVFIDAAGESLPAHASCHVAFGGGDVDSRLDKLSGGIDALIKAYNRRKLYIAAAYDTRVRNAVDVFDRDSSLAAVHEDSLLVLIAQEDRETRLKHARELRDSALEDLENALRLALGGESDEREG